MSHKNAAYRLIICHPQIVNILKAKIYTSTAQEDKRGGISV